MCVCILNTFFVVVKHTHKMYRNIGGKNKTVELDRVMEASGLGGDCFKSMFMEMVEFQKRGEDHYF